MYLTVGLPIVQFLTNIGSKFTKDGLHDLHHSALRLIIKLSLEYRKYSYTLMIMEHIYLYVGRYIIPIDFNILT